MLQVSLPDPLSGAIQALQAACQALQASTELLSEVRTEFRRAAGRRPKATKR
jgi:hypothetical protein